MIKQTNEEKLKESKEILDQLKVLRGGKILQGQKVMANDPQLIEAFMKHYEAAQFSENNVIPPKYHELMMVAFGAVLGMDGTVKVHASKAVSLGATVDELGEVFRSVFMISGLSGLRLAEVFDPIDYDG